MYGSGSITASLSAQQRSLLDSYQYFDSKYTWVRRIRIRGLERPAFPEYTIVGGPRLRMFFPRLHRYHNLLPFMWRVSHMMKLPLPMTLRPAPTLTKIPFVRWLPGTCYQNSHKTNPIKLADVTGVLLHFKFLEDFSARVERDIVEKRHGIWTNVLTRYQAKLTEDPSFGFFYPDSVAYEGSDQLVKLRLLREDQGWRQIREADPT
jgi:hypothetical protein